MNTRKMLAAVAAGFLTISAVLVGYGGTLAQEPSASPAPFVSPAPSPADMPDMEGMPGMNAGDTSSMMGEMMGHMMGHMMDASDSHGWDHSPRDLDRGWDHASRGMMGHGDTSSAEECRQMMGEMKAMMSGSMMGGQPDESGMGMGAASPAPTLDAAASPSTDPGDHAAHHPSPSASPAV
jgi:hypothetical protein